ncbi:hypothetical protein H6P81_014315 [Aristolochia fimbriata]|uniref:NHL repeat-containing protein n=1 Tax=Aristolochia fimbriata TaxID=158543 RepID=A0AAV7EKH3_ARIFI|nr:hypothetical protein H6P81_014315 [Aristolochia fimbriata]
MTKSLVFSVFLALFLLRLQLGADAAPFGGPGPLIKHLSSFVKWTRASPQTPNIDGNLVQFENGYLVETIVEGNKLGVEPYSIRVSQEGELFAVDSVNSNIVRITPPLSQYSRARLVAGSFQGYSGHVDGKPSDARFNHPKGVTMDDKGNVYVADTSNLAIRKIGESGVTTIAGGKSNVAGYRDGPSEDAKFSSDFDVVYDSHTCSLLVIDRGNAAIRQISLHSEDCDYQYSSITASDVMMVIAAILVGYAFCVLQQGSGSLLFSRTISESNFHSQATAEKPSTLNVESIKEDQIAGWPSFGRLFTDLSKLAVEALGSGLLSLVPTSVRFGRSKKGLTPLKDSLVMPEDKPEPPLVQKQRNPSPQPESQQVPSTATNYAQQKPTKSKSGSLKDPSLSSGKHRSSSKRQDFSEFYGSSETAQYSQFSTSKSQKERTRHRHRDKSGEVVFGEKPVEIKPVDYGDPKFDHYNIRSKYGAEDHRFRL